MTSVQPSLFAQQRSDADYVGIPWKDGGFERSGADCRGLTLLWLRENMGFDAPRSDALSARSADEILGDARWKAGRLQRGDVVFFADFRRQKIRHCAVFLGDNSYLHAFKGCESRIVNGHVLLSRMGLVPAGVISPDEAERLCGALADRNLGTAAQIVLLVIAIGLSIASAALAPKRPRTGNTYGRYSDQQNATQVSSELPLADPLGQVVIAGNTPYTQLGEKGAAISDPVQVKWNKIVILGSAPLELIDFETDSGLLINGLAYNDKFFRDTPSISGFLANPPQAKAEAVTGSNNGESHVPTFTTYNGANGISVPVDIRASYDRTFPVYGLSGCAYIVWRLMNSEKHTNFNMTVRVKGRRCRQFDEDGFVQTTVTGESLTGADGLKVRFKLAHDDVVDVTALTVNGTSYSPIRAAAQTGNVYQLNRLKGYVEFIAAPAASATISITYHYYPREWTQNPAMQVVYLLTEKTRGKGYGEERIDWPRAVEMRDYCDDQVIWDGVVQTRYQCDYALDFRKPLQEHLRAVLDSCNGLLFLTGGKFVMKARSAGSSVMSFDQTSILADSFASELLDRADRSNRIKLAYHSEESANAETEVILDDRNDQLAREERIGNDGVKEENLKLAAVANQGQAERLGDLMLREQVNAVRACEFVTNIKGLPLEPGDIIDVTHSADPAWTARKAWIDDIQYDQNDRLKLRCFEYFEPAFQELPGLDAWETEGAEPWVIESGLENWDLEQDPNYLNADMWSMESGETWETEAGQAYQLEAI